MAGNENMVMQGKVDPRSTKGSAQPNSAVKKSEKKVSMASVDPSMDALAQATVPMAINRLIRINLIAWMIVGICAVLTAVAMYFAMTEKVVPVGISPRGVVVPLVSLDKPYLPEARVEGFVSECSRLSFSHSWTDPQSSMARANECYTEDGWSQFRSQIEPLMKDMTESRMNMTVAVRPATVVAKGKTGRGAFIWRLQSIVDVSLEGTTTRKPPTKWKLDIYAVRVPLEQGLQGVQISSIQATPYQPPR